MEETLFEWGERLKKLGFSPKFYQYICGELDYVDWYKENEHIQVEIHPTKEYSKYLESLEVGTEYTPDWAQYIVSSITIYTSEFAYPRGYWYDGKFKGNICLSNMEDFNSLNATNFEKALWMSRNPIQAKNELVIHFIEETNKLFKLHGELFKKYNLKQQESNILLVGYKLDSTEPIISFKHPKIRYSTFNLRYNMWIEKLVYDKYVVDAKGLYGTNYEINVNNISSEELEQYIKNFLSNYCIYES